MNSPAGAMRLKDLFTVRNTKKKKKRKEEKKIQKWNFCEAHAPTAELVSVL